MSAVASTPLSVGAADTVPLPSRGWSTTAVADALSPHASAKGDEAGAESLFSLVHGREQEVEFTASRRAQPRVWLQVVRWLLRAGLHPRAGASTMRVAEDLAGRMDYGCGLVLYGLDGVVRRTGLSRATVKRHIAVLRELGALVWLRHGSKRNLRLPGRAYTATATVYGAVVPPVFDRAMGNQLTGVGYGACLRRVTDGSREQAMKTARASATAASKQAAQGSGRQVGEPHSRGSSPPVGQVRVESGKKDTARVRRSAVSFLHHKITGYGARRPVRQVARDIAIAREVRPLVPWVQREGLRRLAFALRPLIDRGLTGRQIAGELQGMCLGWQPERPAAYLQSILHRDAQQRAELTAAEHSEQQGHGGGCVPNAAWEQALAEVRRREARDYVVVALVGEGEVSVGEAVDKDALKEMKAQAASDIDLVRASIFIGGEAYARALYEEELVRLALAPRSDNIVVGLA